MGKRKLRFDTFCKNYERKKRAEWVLVNPELKISLPLSIYLSNAVSDSNSFCIRLKRTVIASAKAIPDGWTLSLQVDVTCSFTFTKLPFILKVYSDCTWCIVVGTDLVDCQYCEALKNVVSTLTCLKDKRFVASFKVLSAEFYFHKPITVHLELYLFYCFIHFLLYIGQY